MSVFLYPPSPIASLKVGMGWFIEFYSFFVFCYCIVYPFAQSLVCPCCESHMLFVEFFYDDGSV